MILIGLFFKDSIGMYMMEWIFKLMIDLLFRNCLLFVVFVEMIVVFLLSI